MPSSAQTEVQVHLRGVHLCCGGCTSAVDDAVAGVVGARSRCDLDAGTVAVVARDRDAARKALDAIADAGLHGGSDDPTLTMRTESHLPPGEVQKLTVFGVHNCCDLCRDAIKGAVASVPGVAGTTVQAGETSFDVVGRFSAAELLRSLNAAGFHARVKT